MSFRLDLNYSVSQPFASFSDAENKGKISKSVHPLFDLIGLDEAKFRKVAGGYRQVNTTIFGGGLPKIDQFFLDEEEASDEPSSVSPLSAMIGGIQFFWAVGMSGDLQSDKEIQKVIEEGKKSQEGMNYKDSPILSKIADRLLNPEITMKQAAIDLYILSEIASENLQALGLLFNLDMVLKKTGNEHCKFDFRSFVQTFIQQVAVERIAERSKNDFFALQALVKLADIGNKEGIKSVKAIDLIHYDHPKNGEGVFLSLLTRIAIDYKNEGALRFLEGKRVIDIIFRPFNSLTFNLELDSSFERVSIEDKARFNLAVFLESEAFSALLKVSGRNPHAIPALLKLFHFYTENSSLEISPIRLQQLKVKFSSLDLTDLQYLAQTNFDAFVAVHELADVWKHPQAMEGVASLSSPQLIEFYINQFNDWIVYASPAHIEMQQIDELKSLFAVALRSPEGSPFRKILKNLDMHWVVFLVTQYPDLLPSFLEAVKKNLFSLDLTEKVKGFDYLFLSSLSPLMEYSDALIAQKKQKGIEIVFQPLLLRSIVELAHSNNQSASNFLQRLDFSKILTEASKVNQEQAVLTLSQLIIGTRRAENFFRDAFLSTFEGMKNENLSPEVLEVKGIELEFLQKAFERTLQVVSGMENKTPRLSALEDRIDNFMKRISPDGISLVRRLQIQFLNQEMPDIFGEMEDTEKLRVVEEILSVEKSSGKAVSLSGFPSFVKDRVTDIRRVLLKAKMSSHSNNFPDAFTVKKGPRLLN